MSGFDVRSAGSDADLLKEAIRAQLVEINTWMPGEVVTFDSAAQTASIQLCLEREVLDEFNAIVQLDEVPLVVQSAGGFSVTFPVAAGDPCMVFFAQRGIDNWYLDGGCQKQATRRHHHLSDAVFMPGLKAAPDALGGYDTSNFVIRTDDGANQFCMTPSGQFALSNGTAELVSIVDELAQAVASLQTTVTSGSSSGSWTHNQVAAVNSLRSRLQTLKQ